VVSDVREIRICRSAAPVADVVTVTVREDVADVVTDVGELGSPAVVLLVASLLAVSVAVEVAVELVG
jgi:hypothetical protein